MRLDTSLGRSNSIDTDRLSAGSSEAYIDEKAVGLIDGNNYIAHADRLQGLNKTGAPRAVKNAGIDVCPPTSTRTL